MRSERVRQDIVTKHTHTHVYSLVCISDYTPCIFQNSVRILVPNRKLKKKQVLNKCLFFKTSWKERKKINRWINGWVNKRGCELSRQ